jgi:hypothetical protein
MPRSRGDGSEDTKKSILSKINGLRYQTGEDQGAFNEFFDVREIVDKFYAEYEKVREKLAKSITFPAGIDPGEKDGYATTLMNRLVFTYFLQTPDPATGKAVIPERFLQTLYGKHASRPGQSYYHCLCHLWFEYFNVEKPRTKADGIFEHVPYLNGGLFARRAGIEDDGTKLLYPDIDVPDGTWEEIFTLLDGYNWTIVESDEDDDELSISPSILGHIYEKACNQKETGSYYTPDHVTTYIARECISKLATDRVNEHFKTSYENFLDVLNKDALVVEEIKHVVWFREIVLHDITVCDNACGSGAFLLAAEKILVDLHQQCNKWWEPGGGKHLPTLHAIKKHVVTRNIYGVDLQPGSVEIAKLRLWLSMIPAMQSSGKVEPLPNIDYNILAGNSLVGFVKLPSNWGKSLLSNPDKLKRKLDEYRGLKDAFRSATASADREDLKEKIDAIRKAVRAELDALLKEDLAITTDQVAALKPFHWGFECEEVFSRGGFDAIIGNPPYVRQETVKTLIPEMNYTKFLNSIYNKNLGDGVTIAGKTDFSTYFIFRSATTIKKHGIHSYIITAKWLRASYGRSIRYFLRKKVVLNSFIDLTGKKIFLGINIDTVIYSILNNPNIQSKVSIFFNEPSRANTIDDLSMGGYQFPIRYLSDDIWTFMKNEDLAIRDHLESMHHIEDLNVNIRFGIKTGFNDAFIIDEVTRNKLIAKNTINGTVIKPLISGREIGKFNVKWEHKYLIYIPWHFPLDPLDPQSIAVAEERFIASYPDIYAHLEQYKSDLSARAVEEVGIRYEWYALQRFGSTYYKELEQPKLIWQRVTSEAMFVFDKGNYYPLDSNAFMTGDIAILKSLKLLLSSSFIEKYYLPHFVHQYGKTGYLLSNQFVNPIPVPEISSITRRALIALFDIIQTVLTNDEILGSLSKLADMVSFDVYFKTIFIKDGIRDANRGLIEFIDEIIKGNNDATSLINDPRIVHACEQISNHWIFKSINKGTNTNHTNDE